MQAQREEFERYFKHFPKYLRWARAAQQLNYPTVREALVDLYRSRTMKEMGNLLGFTSMSVCYMMKRLNIDADPQCWEIRETWYGYGRSPLERNE